MSLSRTLQAAILIAIVTLAVRVESQTPAPAASTQGAGAGPASGFDPTGSHPLPNESVEGRSSKSGCGCNAVGR